MHEKIITLYRGRKQQKRMSYNTDHIQLEYKEPRQGTETRTIKLKCYNYTALEYKEPRQGTETFSRYSLHKLSNLYQNIKNPDRGRKPICLNCLYASNPLEYKEPRQGTETHLDLLIFFTTIYQNIKNPDRGRKRRLIIFF